MMNRLIPILNKLDRVNIATVSIMMVLILSHFKASNSCWLSLSFGFQILALHRVATIKTILAPLTLKLFALVILIRVPIELMCSANILIDERGNGFCQILQAAILGAFCGIHYMTQRVGVFHKILAL